MNPRLTASVIYVYIICEWVIYLYIYISVWIYVYVCFYMCLCMYTCVFYIYIYIYIYVWCMCVYVYTCVCVCIGAMCVYIYIYIYIMFVWVCICWYICVRAYLCFYKCYIYIYTYIYTHVNVFVGINPYTCVLRIYIYIYIYIYIHFYTHDAMLIVIQKWNSERGKGCCVLHGVNLLGKGLNESFPAHHQLLVVRQSNKISSSVKHHSGNINLGQTHKYCTIILGRGWKSNTFMSNRKYRYQSLSKCFRHISVYS